MDSRAGPLRALPTETAVSPVSVVSRTSPASHGSKLPAGGRSVEDRPGAVVRLCCFRQRLTLVPEQPIDLGRGELTPLACQCLAQQEATETTVTLADVDQGSTGEVPTRAMVKLPAAKSRVMVLPRRGVVARSFAGATRFRRFANDDDRLPEKVAGAHVVALSCLMRHQRLTLTAQNP